MPNSGRGFEMMTSNLLSDFNAMRTLRREGGGRGEREREREINHSVEAYDLVSYLDLSKMADESSSSSEVSIKKHAMYFKRCMDVLPSQCEALDTSRSVHTPVPSLIIVSP